MNSVHAHFLLVATVAFCFAGRTAAEDAGKLEDALAEPVSLKIEQSSLEECLNLLAKKVRTEHDGFAIKIIGEDLQREGITRNQTIRDYAERDRSAAEILTDLVVRADPNSGTKDPSDPELRLIWIVAANPDDAQKLAILITTRAGAAKRGDKLPKVFHLKDK